MNIEEPRVAYWCHSCKCEFTSHLPPGRTDIRCPSCSHEFCQLINPHAPPKHFQPYQKQPIKKESRTLRLGQKAATVNLIILQQILEEQQHQREGIEITEEQLNSYKKRLQKDSECSVCREELKGGQQHLMFDCRHAFHKQCLVDWLKIKNSCPTCRQRMVPSD